MKARLVISKIFLVWYMEERGKLFLKQEAA